VQHCVPTSRKRPKSVAGRQATRLQNQLGAQVRDLRTDAGLSLRELAAAAGVDAGYLGQVELGLREPSFSVLAAIGEALGADLSVRFYPNTGPRVRDHIQAAIVEELLRIAHPRWRRFTEVPVYRPARGRVDTVLYDSSAALVVATEVHSQIRRLEQQQGWSNLKAESLPSADFWRHLDREPRISQLLVLRSTRATRELVGAFEGTIRAVYPARCADVFAALIGDGQWLASGLLWAKVDGGAVRILDRPPRGVSLGR
jgi:transcriptional regulator with XRE-family HTH domain